MVKILEGLYYLHEQNVVHCDLKAANILTTKNGNVKLSDFGVSLNLKAVKKMGNKNDAIGTPNWMAPEVIELKGVTTAADIWSLGCTIIELLTGKPPYYDMLAMSAMFRIVEDDCPPIPEKCSDGLRDLLMQCFNKDPAKRPSAETLFEHEWIGQVWTNHKELRPQDSVPFLRRISADRRLDPRMFEKEIKEEGSVAQPPMERSTSSPPRTLQRPDLEALRAHTSPPESSVVIVTDKVDGISPATSPPADTSSLPSLDMASTHSSSKVMGTSPGPVPVSPTMLSPMGDTSLLDLGLIGDEEAKPHAFVKSTFSKALSARSAASRSRSTPFFAKSAVSSVMPDVLCTLPRLATCERSSCFSSNGHHWIRPVRCRRQLIWQPCHPCSVALRIWLRLQSTSASPLA